MGSSAAVPRRAAPPSGLERGYTKLVIAAIRDPGLRRKHVEKQCLHYIYQRTVGWGYDRAQIPPETFMRVTGASRPAVDKAITFLIRGRYISRTYEFGQRVPFYSCAPRFHPRKEEGKRAYGLCHQCHATTECEIEPPGDYAMTPNDYLTGAAACLPGPVYDVGLEIIIGQWGSDDGVPRPWAELSNQEIRAGTGLHENTVRDALATGERLGVFESDDPERSERPAKGRRIKWRINVANIAKLARREARVVVQPKRSEKKVNGGTEKTELSLIEPSRTPPREYDRGKAFARCFSCRAMALFSLCPPPSKLDLHRAAAKKPPRSDSPPRASDLPPMPGLHETLRDYGAAIGCTVDEPLVLKFRIALGEATLEEFRAKVARRWSYILRNAQGLGLLLRFAEDCGRLAAGRAEERRAAEEAQLQRALEQREREERKKAVARRDDPWEQVKRNLARDIAEVPFENWIAPTYLARTEEEVFIVCVPDQATKDWIEQEYSEDVRAAMHAAGASLYRVRYEVEKAAGTVGGRS